MVTGDALSIYSATCTTAYDGRYMWLVQPSRADSRPCCVVILVRGSRLTRMCSGAVEDLKTASVHHLRSLVFTISVQNLWRSSIMHFLYACSLLLTFTSSIYPCHCFLYWGITLTNVYICGLFVVSIIYEIPSWLLIIIF